MKGGRRRSRDNRRWTHRRRARRRSTERRLDIQIVGGSESANTFGVDLHMPSQVIRTCGSVGAELALVWLFLGVNALVAFKVARADGLVRAPRVLAVVVVHFLRGSRF